ncbi:MAG: FAD-dependent oxidoreductase [Microbacteriaceae bacterium]|nr:MAG: FAD-dependent oxidoreductase [Microbacteriaceae bacterium]
MTSLWHADAPEIPTDPFPDGGRFDHLVVGAGLTGLTTALLLARRGRSVAVLEPRTVGAVATGNTTAKLSVLQGVRLQRVRSRNIRSVFEAYVASQRAAFDWMVDYLTDCGVAFERRPAVTWAETPEERGRCGASTRRRAPRAFRCAGRRTSRSRSQAMAQSCSTTRCSSTPWRCSPASPPTCAHSAASSSRGRAYGASRSVRRRPCTPCSAPCPHRPSCSRPARPSCGAGSTG